MTILVLGASGLIGNAVLSSLRAAGLPVLGQSRKRPLTEVEQHWRELRFAELDSIEAWQPFLHNVDVVINCVGIISERSGGDFDRLHRRVPCALIAACEKFGVKQVIQISALGAQTDAATEYWRSKAAADHFLLEVKCKATVIRPSLVYGDEGASSRIFKTMASLPLAIFPYAKRARVQPVHVQDLADVVVELVQKPTLAPRELVAVGPRAMTIADYLQCLSAGMACRAPRVVEMPLWLATPAAHLSATIPGNAFTPAALLMLEDGIKGGNTGDATAMTRILGRALRDPARFATPAQHAETVLAWAQPLLRYTLALLWLWTAMVSWFFSPHEQSMSWLVSCGIPGTWTVAVLALSAALDALMGFRLLWRPPSWIWPTQLLVIATYTVWLTVCLPEFWLHPFGPLSKNAPVFALVLMLWCLQKRKF